MSRLQIKWHFIAAVFILSSVVALLLAVGGRAPAGQGEKGRPTTLAATGGAPSAAQHPAPPPQVIEARIKKGATASQLLGAYLSPGEIHELAEQCRPIFPLSRLDVGQEYRLTLLGKDFERFAYDIDADEQLVIGRQGEGFKVSRKPIRYRTVRKVVCGTITTNLFDAVAASGEQPELALTLADLFAWDVDFIRDLRRGDTFRVLIEKRFRQGRPAGYGKVLAAEFVNQGVTYQAFRFAHHGVASYYDAQGRNIRKAFLKVPLAFTRISSGYSLHRLHPITKTWRPHPAIDYAAPPGTPIKSVGDGVICRIGYNRFNGNFIKIRHRGAYETIYLHMERFAKGMKMGKKLLQGQVIGYVGSTGLATGPHL